MRRTIVVLATAVMLAAPTAGTAAPALPHRLMGGFQSPESVFWDAATNAWYISNFGGVAPGFGDHDGNGFITKLPADGAPRVFVNGLDAPQGVTISNGTMYVADIDHLRVIDMADPARRADITIEGASLGDPSVDERTGDVYVSDIGNNQIWRVRDGEADVFLRTPAPDGVWVADGAVYFDNLGLGGEAGVYRADIATGDVSVVALVPGGNLDGLIPDGHGGWLVTDFFRGLVLRVTEGHWEIVSQLAPTTADLGYDPVAGLAAVPMLGLNTVAFLDA